MPKGSIDRSGGTMPEVVPVDDFVNAEWYPGFTPGRDHAAWIAEPLDTFRKEDEDRFWFLDFHWPRGLSPMGITYAEDCSSFAAQLAAEALPLPPGRGITQRLAGTHLYESEVPVDSSWEIAARAERLGRNLPRFLTNFSDIWAESVLELESGLQYFERYDFKGRSLDELGQYVVDARRFHKRAWEIHFEIMYPLLANFLGLYGVATNVGIDPAQVSKFLQGEDTKIMEVDRRLWDLAAEARRLRLDGVFAKTPPDELRRELAAQGGNAGIWLTAFTNFLQTYGWRTEGIADINLESWVENPTPALGTIKTFLQMEDVHDFDKARRQAVEERDTAVEEARSGLKKEQRAAFDTALESCRTANFSWWNEEHNYYIDLRAMIPMRRGCLALAETLGTDGADDLLYVFWPELLDLVARRRKVADLRTLITARREYYQHWLDRRPAMPKVLGTIPDSVTDPVLIEIFGMHHHFFEGLKSTETETLVGLAASSGKARGRAQVLHGAEQLHLLQPGDVLVCEATSPNWTPAFAKIAACVCDGGGSLTHASIVSREYRIPCVVGLSRATSAIKSGDLVEVDGTKGIVRILQRV